MKASGDEAFDLLNASNPDVILLNLVIRRSDFKETMARLQETFEVENIDAMTLKPSQEDTAFSGPPEKKTLSYLDEANLGPRILVGRINASLRREASAPSSPEESTIRLRDLVMNVNRREVYLSGKKIRMTNAEFNTLHFLVRRPGWVYTRTQILRAIHGTNCNVEESAVTFQIMKLRRKLGKAGHYIETVKGFGYRVKDFSEQDDGKGRSGPS
ncbi:MAG: response regulator transcription factor [Desulfobacteraceae bacterium]